MRPPILLLFALLLFSASTNAQKILTADEVLSAATREAAKTQKKVMVIFHASWCGWCHRMDTALADPVVKPYFDRNFVITHLTVYESEGKKNLENPGALELLTRYGGNDQGIPFWVILDSKGKLLADSFYEKDKNSGCPAQPQEVAYFVNVLKKHTAITETEATSVSARFARNARD